MIGLLIVSMLVIGAGAALADEVVDVESRHEEMLAYKAEWLAEKVAAGIITQEQADEYLADMQARFDECDCDGTCEEDPDHQMFDGHGRQNRLNEDGLRLGDGEGFGGGHGAGRGMGRGHGAKLNDDCVLDD